MVAQRATSPKAPKAKTSRASSPLAQGTVSAGNSRATSPVAGSPTSPSVKSNGTKRKAGDDGSSAPSPPGNGGPPKAKKRKGPSGVTTGAVGELDNNAVIEWLKRTPNANTRDCIRHFGPYLTDEATKARFTELIKEVAQLKGGILVLRNAYRGNSPVEGAA